MEIKINYQGRDRKVTLRELKEYPIDVVYECQVEGYGTLKVALTENGKGREEGGDNHLLASLIIKEKKRAENMATNDKTFDLSLDYQGKKYYLQITPVESETSDRYRVIANGEYLFNVFAPDAADSHWHTSYGRSQEDQRFAAAIGAAIENR